MIRIVLADDHDLIRQGIRHILENNKNMTIIDELANGNDLIACLRKKKADIVVLDLSMPGRNGIDLIRIIHKQWPQLPILVLTMHDEEQYAVRALKAGAKGFMSKDVAADKLEVAITKVAAGKIFVSENVTSLLTNSFQSKQQEHVHETLSPREFEIFLALVSGETVSQISQRMHISVSTVSTHKNHISEKLKMKSIAQWVQYATQNNLMKSV